MNRAQKQRAQPQQASADAFSKFHDSDISQLRPEPVPGYKLHGKLGRGGMGSIYLADDPYLNLTALKLVPNFPQGHPSFHLKEWFTRECVATLIQSHQNIVQSHEAGETKDYLYLSLEVLEGGSLRELLHKRKRLEWEQARSIILDLCGGLESAHGTGVIHRDLKTENVMLTHADEGLKAKIIDFGLCYISGYDDIYPYVMDIPFPMEPLMSSPSGKFGTPEYRAPEYDQPFLNRSETFDIYSAGMMLYEMVAGSLPFGPVAATDFEQRNRIFDHLHKNVAPPLPSETCYGLALPAGVEGIIMSAIEKSPLYRIQTAGEMRRAIEACG